MDCGVSASTQIYSKNMEHKSENFRKKTNWNKLWWWKKFELKFNEYIFKITDLIENFQLNVAIAKIYEVASLMESNIERKINNKKLLISQIKFMKMLLPFAPHLSCECLSKLEGKTSSKKFNGQNLIKHC